MRPGYAGCESKVCPHTTLLYQSPALNLLPKLPPPPLTTRVRAQGNGSYYILKKQFPISHEKEQLWIFKQKSNLRAMETKV